MYTWEKGSWAPFQAGWAQELSKSWDTYEESASDLAPKTMHMLEDSQLHAFRRARLSVEGNPWGSGCSCVGVE